MEVVAIVHAYPPDVRAGAEIMLYHMMQAMRDRGHVVKVANPGTGEGMAIMRCSNPHVVITQLLHADIARVYAQGRGAKFAQVFHNDNRSSRIQARIHHDLTICNTNWLRKALRLGGIVVHPPVWPEHHKTTPGDCITLVNLIREKGADTFYALAKRMPDRKFLGVKGGYGKQIIKRRDNVEIIDNTPDMKRDVWSRTGVLLMPSHYESYGMVAVEAACSGIPVLYHPTAGLKEAMDGAGIGIHRSLVVDWESAIRSLDGDLGSADRAARLDTEGELRAFCEAMESL